MERFYTLKHSTKVDLFLTFVHLMCPLGNTCK